MTFPAGSHEFFWISDRDGWQHEEYLDRRRAERPGKHRRGRAELWRHPYCYLTTPLLRRGCERIAIGHLRGGLGQVSILSSLFFNFGGRMGYNRYASAVIGFLREGRLIVEGPPRRLRESRSSG